MNKTIATFSALCVLSLNASGAQAIERCFSAIDGVQIAVDAGGAPKLYVYSTEFGGSNYMTYSGSIDVLKAFHAQLLYARATEQRVCVAYTPGTPSYVW